MKGIMGDWWRRENLSKGLIVLLIGKKRTFKISRIWLFSIIRVQDSKASPNGLQTPINLQKDRNFLGGYVRGNFNNNDTTMLMASLLPILRLN